MAPSKLQLSPYNYKPVSTLPSVHIMCIGGLVSVYRAAAFYAANSVLNWNRSWQLTTSLDEIIFSSFFPIRKTSSWQLIVQRIHTNKH